MVFPKCHTRRIITELNIFGSNGLYGFSVAGDKQFFFESSGDQRKIGG